MFQNFSNHTRIGSSRFSIAHGLYQRLCAIAKSARLLAMHFFCQGFSQFRRNKAASIGIVMAFGMPMAFDGVAIGVTAMDLNTAQTNADLAMKQSVTAGLQKIVPYALQVNTAPKSTSPSDQALSQDVVNKGISAAIKELNANLVLPAGATVKGALMNYWRDSNHDIHGVIDCSISVPTPFWALFGISQITIESSHHAFIPANTSKAELQALASIK